MPNRPFAERNGWRLYAHPAFGDAFDVLNAAVAKLKQQAPHAYTNHPKAKLLKRVLDLILDEIPRDPNAPAFQLGNTLGASHRHWRRAKFLGRFRLFYRFSSAHRVIICAWVNDEATLRKAGSATDPYSVFSKRLREDNPPDDWDDLVRAAASARQPAVSVQPARGAVARASRDPGKGKR
jgi:toxin YhaV